MKNRSKIILPKNISLKSFSYSHCASTNDSKQNKQILKKENSLLQKQSAIQTRKILQNNLQKYSTSEQEYFLNYFQNTISLKEEKNQTFNLNKKLTQICTKDIKFDLIQQNMQGKYNKNQIQKELTELTQYYKYYTNNPILYHKENFKNLYHYYEKKKYVQYKRLKAILNLQGQSNQNLSSSSKNQNISEASSQIINQDTFYIGPFINQTQISQKRKNQSKNQTQSSLCQSQAFQNLNFQMNYLMHNNKNNKMLPLGKKIPNSFAHLLNENKIRQQKQKHQIKDLDQIYDFRRKQKNGRKKSQQIHQSSKKLSKSSKKLFVNAKDQFVNAKEKNCFAQFINKIDQKKLVNYGLKSKNRRLNSCQTVLSNNFQKIQNNSSKYGSTTGSIKKRSRNIHSLQKIETLKSQIDRDKCSQFKIFVKKQNKFKQRMKKSNLATNKNSPDLKSCQSGKISNISIGNSHDKKMLHKYKNSNISIQPFQSHEKNDNQGQIQKQRKKNAKNSKEIIIEQGIQGLKKRIKQQKKRLIELKDLKESKIGFCKKQKKQEIQEDKKREKGTLKHFGSKSNTNIHHFNKKK